MRRVENKRFHTQFSVKYKLTRLRIKFLYKFLENIALKESTLESAELITAAEMAPSPKKATAWNNKMSKVKNELIIGS